MEEITLPSFTSSTMVTTLRVVVEVVDEDEDKDFEVWTLLRMGVKTIFLDFSES